jgi:transposase-like protein
MACRPSIDEHETTPDVTSVETGTDRAGKGWKVTHYKCPSCGTTWKEGEGAGF